MIQKDTNEVLKEVASISPLIAALPKNTSDDSVPEGYFDDFENTMCSQIFLTQYSGQYRSVDISEDYFSSWEERVVQMDQIAKSKATRRPVMHLWRQYQTLIAAVFVFILVTITVFYIQKTENSGNNDGYLELQNASYAYLENNIDDFDIDMLIAHDLLEESDVTVISDDIIIPSDSAEYVLPVSQILF